jgi:hypothetical protein
MEPHSGKRRPVWTTSSPKTGPKWVCRGLVDLSTMSNGSTSVRAFSCRCCSDLKTKQASSLHLRMSLSQ